MIGANIAIGVGSSTTTPTDEAGGGGDEFTITVAQVAVPQYHGFSAEGYGGLPQDYGTRAGQLADGLVPDWLVCIDSVVDQFQVSFIGDFRSALEGRTITMDGEPLWVDITEGVNMEFTSGNTTVSKVAPPPALWGASNIGETHVFTLLT